jgi:hypothetical protein
MFKFILRTIFQQNKMHDSTLDLFCDHESEEFADEYAKEIELLAEKYEVTADYIILEFILD